jgi:arylsulfatase A-like enzyme
MILEELERLELLAETMIIVLADHGEVMDEAKGKQFGHGTLDYGGLGIPLIMHLPEIVPSRTDAFGTAQCIDVLPTVTALLELDDQAHRQGIFLFSDGVQALTVRRPAFASGDILKRDEYTVITPQWQYTQLGEEASLHRLESGPHASADVLGDHPEIADSLGHMLSAWMDRCLAEAVIPFSKDVRSAEPGEDVRRRLKALGYIQ